MEGAPHGFPKDKTTTLSLFVCNFQFGRQDWQRNQIHQKQLDSTWMPEEGCLGIIQLGIEWSELRLWFGEETLLAEDQKIQK